VGASPAIQGGGGQFHGYCCEQGKDEKPFAATNFDNLITKGGELRGGILFDSQNKRSVQ